jgi:quinol monooxygenase YgiN
MIIGTMSITVAHTKRQQIGSALASLVGPTQVQQGCLSCELYQGWSNEELLRIESRWANQVDLIRHLQSDTYKSLLLLMELASAPPVLEFKTIVEIRGLDLVKSARDATV